MSNAIWRWVESTHTSSSVTSTSKCAFGPRRTCCCWETVPMRVVSETYGRPCSHSQPPPKKLWKMSNGLACCRAPSFRPSWGTETFSKQHCAKNADLPLRNDRIFAFSGLCVSARPKHSRERMTYLRVGQDLICYQHRCDQKLITTVIKNIPCAISINFSSAPGSWFRSGWYFRLCRVRTIALKQR